MSDDYNDGDDSSIDLNLDSHPNSDIDDLEEPMRFDNDSAKTHVHTANTAVAPGKADNGATHRSSASIDATAPASAPTTATVTAAANATDNDASVTVRSQQCPLCASAFDLGAHLPVLLHAGHSFCLSCVFGGSSAASAAAAAAGAATATSTAALFEPVGSQVQCPLCALPVTLPDDSGAREASVATLYERLSSSSSSSSAAAADTTLAAIDRSSLPPSPLQQGGTAVQLAQLPINFAIIDRLLTDADAGAAKANVAAATTAAAAAAAGRDDRLRVYCPLHNREVDGYCRDCRRAVCADCTASATAAAAATTATTVNANAPVTPRTKAAAKAAGAHAASPSKASAGASAHTSAHTVEALVSASSRAMGALAASSSAAKAHAIALHTAAVAVEERSRAVATRAAEVEAQVDGYFARLHAALEARKGDLVGKLRALAAAKMQQLQQQQNRLIRAEQSAAEATQEVEQMLAMFDPHFAAAAAAATTPTAAATATDSTSHTGTGRTSSPSLPPVSGRAQLLRVATHLQSTLDTLSRYAPAPTVPVEDERFAFFAADDAAAAAQQRATRTAASTRATSPTPPIATAAATTSPQQQQQQQQQDDVGIDDRLLLAISRTGRLSDDRAYAPLCTTKGDGLLPFSSSAAAAAAAPQTPAYAKAEHRFVIRARDRCGYARRSGGDAFSVDFLAAKGTAAGRVIDNADGTYTVRYCFSAPGRYGAIVSLAGAHISGSPFTIVVSPAQTQQQGPVGKEVISSIGSRGDRHAQLMQPFGVAIGLSAASAAATATATVPTLYVSEFANGRISCYSVASLLAAATITGNINVAASASFVRHIGSISSNSGKPATSTATATASTATTATAAQSLLHHPWGICVDPLTDNLFVADSGHHRIVVFSAAGEYVHSFGSVGGKPGSFRQPAGIAIYTPPTKERLRALQQQQQQQSSGESSEGDAIENGISSSINSGVDSTIDAPASFSSTGTLLPSLPSIVQQQLLFVCDREKHRIQCFTLSGEFVRTFGSGGAGPGQMLHPTAVAVDPLRQCVYVVDASNNRVQRFGLNGAFQTMWGVRGTMKGQFVEAMAIAVDRDGQVYVADQHRIQVFSSDGDFLRFAGAAGNNISGSDKSLFVKPSGIAFAAVTEDGTLVHAHEAVSAAASSSATSTDSSTADTAAAESTASTPTLAGTLVFVSDAASHKVHVLK